MPNQTVDIVMPRLSDSMEEGTVLKWLKAVGDSVERGEDLVEVETDKANMTYPSDTAGELVELLAEEGDTLPIGTPIARISPAAQEGRLAASSQEPDQSRTLQYAPSPAPTASLPDRPPEQPQRSEPPPEEGARILASPIARKLAREKGVDLSALAGSGPGGRIVKADVEAAGPGQPAARAAESAAPTQVEPTTTAKGSVETVELTRLQRTVARRMAESKATAPHFYLQVEIDMNASVELREQLKAMKADPVPTYNDMVVKACALALREFPRANGAYRDGKVELHERVNVGVAVAANDALVVPTVLDADTKSLGEIARETRELAERVRSGAITPPELSGGTFTVSNLGMYGIDSFQAVINPPQAALLAIGAIKKRALVDRDSGGLVVRPTVHANLACDHRILYGADGAEFLGRVRELLEEPAALTL